MNDGRQRYRASVRVSDRVRGAALQPELVGLPAGTSASAVYSRLLERGYDAAMRAAREQQQLTAAAAYARDPERRRVAHDLQRVSVRRGIV